MNTLPFYAKLHILLIFILCLTGIVCASADEYSEKANHLYQFAKYVQWPKMKTLDICVIGADPFGNKLNGALAGRSVGGRTLQAVRLAQNASVSSCHLLFISQRLQNNQVKSILQRANQTTVTVGEQKGFLGLGGIINFINENNKVRYEVNQTAASKRGIKLGYRLVKLAARIQ